jgi:hypothetical protein
MTIVMSMEVGMFNKIVDWILEVVFMVMVLLNFQYPDRLRRGQRR